jgi:hypothetical protein
MNALVHTKNQANGTQYNYTIPQDSYFFVDPYKVKYIFTTNYLFDLSKEIGIVEKVDAQSSLEAFIPLIKHQAKLALYIVERSKDKHLNTHYYYEPFQKNKTLNWCTRLLCALTWLEKSFVSTKQIVFGLETVSRFFFPKTISLCPLPNVRKTHKIKKRLRGNILFAKKILAALFTRSSREVAKGLKKAVLESNRTKGTKFQSAMSMLNYYINRSGKKLPREDKERLEQAKVELRKIFHKE